MDPITATIVAVFQAAAALWASLGTFGQFLVSTLFNAAVSGSKQPGLSDLKIQTSTYGKPIPRLYGATVRVAGNVIDKSDLLPVKHKKGSIAGLGGVKYYTYDAHLHVLLAEGIAIAPNGLKRIYANGKVVFDRDATGATAGETLANGALQFGKVNKTQGTITYVRLYRGEATQGVDPLFQTLHPGEVVPAYRGVTSVVFERIALADFGSRVPNLEFEVEPMITTLDAIVEDIAATADVAVDTTSIRLLPCRGFVAANDGSAWDAINPLGAAFAFDLVMKGAGFKTVSRGGAMRTLIAETEYAAAPVGERPASTKEARVASISKVPDELAVNYLDPTRDYQPSTQRAGRSATIGQNKLSVDVPIVLTDTEARNLAQRSLFEAAARLKMLKVTLSNKYRWLDAGDLIGLQIAGQYEPFRINTVTSSPNGMIDLEVTFEDSLIYIGILTGDAGNFPTNSLELAGDTTALFIDAAITRDTHDDVGFLAIFAGASAGWRGAEVYRALGVGSPLTYDVVGNIGVGGVVATCDTTLASGPTDVWDRVNTLTVTPVDPDDTLSSATEAEVLGSRANIAWVGAADGHDGEYIQFATVTPTSPPGSYILSDLLRGRFGTEALVGTHGGGERFALMTDPDVLYRIVDTAATWNATYTYRADSLPDLIDGTPQTFENTGEGKRPLNVTHLRGDRDGSGDVVISWTRRTRLSTPAIGGGAVPLGEDAESYALDIYNGATVVRSEVVTTPTYTYTSAAATADGNTPGALVRVDVYQMSGVYGRGQVTEGTV